jgi:hypothetical protein
MQRSLSERIQADVTSATMDVIAVFYCLQYEENLLLDHGAKPGAKRWRLYERK